MQKLRRHFHPQKFRLPIFDLRFFFFFQENSVVAGSDIVKVGDHIEAINQQSTIGFRHYQVAKILKNIPMGSTFTLYLVEPQKAFGKPSKINAIILVQVQGLIV